MYDFGCMISDFGFGMYDFRISDFGCRIWDFGLGTSFINDIYHNHIINTSTVGKYVYLIWQIGSGSDKNSSPCNLNHKLSEV